MLSAGPAAALTINLIDIGGVTGSQAEVGFKAAARYWESVFTNDATINLEVRFAKLGPNVLGSTGTALETFVPISDYYAALAATGTSALDAQALANLSPLNGNGGVNVLVPGYLEGSAGIDVLADPRLAPDNAINQTIAVANANLKALGLIPTSGPIDGRVQFSSDFAFDFDSRNGVSVGTYDFVGVAVHEIGHALGFISGADDFDYSDGYPGGDVDDFWWGYGLDMFRYSSKGQLDWTPDTDSYFSIDGGATAFMDGYFSTGENTGNGWQASHWLPPGGPPCEDLRGIMNPYICSGVTDTVEALDLALFDAIGWNVNVDVLTNPGYSASTADMRAAVPEPATWALLIAGFGMTGAVLRRRRLAVAR